MTLRLRRRARDGRTVLLAAADGCGTGLDVSGVPFVRNDGRLTVGNGVVIRSAAAPSHFVTGQDGHLSIGDRVLIGHGTGIGCVSHVDVGDDAIIGSFSLVMDSDFHVAGDDHAKPVSSPIVIGRRVRLGPRVVVLPGARIGDDAVVAPGSVVSGVVPAGASVAGNPAVAARAHAAMDVAAFVAAVFELAAPPALTSGMHDIDDWDSLGVLRLAIAAETAYGVTIDERLLPELTTVAQLDRMVRTLVAQK